LPALRDHGGSDRTVRLRGIIRLEIRESIPKFQG